MQKISKETNIKSQTQKKKNDSNGSPNKSVFTGKDSEQTSPMISIFFPSSRKPTKKHP